MKNITFILFMTISAFAFSQDFTIIDENYDTNGCVNEVNIEFTITNYDPFYNRYYLYTTGASGTTEPRFRLYDVNGNGTYTTGLRPINETSHLRLRRRSFISSKTVWSTLIIACQNDVDSDGILNENDECPNDYGNSSNFGCPGNPDIAVYGDSEVSSPIWGNGTFNEVSTSNRLPLARFQGGFIDITKFAIENIGDGENESGNSVDVEFYISTDTSVSNDDFTRSSWSIINNMNVPSPGLATPYAQRPGLKIEGSTIGDNLSYGNYYLLISLDEQNELMGSESNTSNNTYALPIVYKSHVFSNSKDYNSIVSTDLELKEYRMDIYDFSGSLVKSKTVSSIKEENEILNLLKSGFYIVKTPFSNRKVLK